MKHIALLRSVNVGGHNKLPMAELRKHLTSFGYQDVATYIQSGNVVLSTARPEALAEELASLLRTNFDIHVPVIVRDHQQLIKASEACPFPTLEPNVNHVGFFARAPAPERIALLDPDRGGQDRWQILGLELYAHVPGGMGRTKLTGGFFDQLKEPVTFRNWRTLEKLIQMSAP